VQWRAVSNQVIIMFIIETAVSLASTAVGVALSKGHDKVIRPWYEDKLHQGLRTDGKWEVTMASVAADGQGLAEDWLLSATIIQKGHVLGGTAEGRHRRADGVAESVHYDVWGTIYNRVVIVTMRCKDRALLTSDTFHLEVVESGQMVGIRTFYGGRRKRVRAIECGWWKDGFSRSTTLCSVPITA
jgi:hypothetical protein